MLAAMLVRERTVMVVSVTAWGLHDDVDDDDVVGYSWDGRGEGGVGHHSDGRQLYEYRESGDVGSQRVRQHREIPSVPADRQLCGRRRRVPGSMRHQGLDRFKILLSRTL